MKNLKNLIVLCIGLAIMITTCLLSYDLGVKDAELKQEILESHIENGTDNSIKFIWNDDIESLPTDGSPILIEFTSKDTIYIGPYEYKQLTYKQ